MDFVPDGWLPSFSEAIELYETTRFGERPTEYDQPILRLFALNKAQREGQRLTDDEEQELSALIPIYRKASLVMSQRRAEALEQVQQKLYDEVIKAAIQDRDTGKFYPIPGSFWTSENAKKAINPRPGIYPYVSLNAVGVAHGPVRIWMEDVIEAAKLAFDPPAKLTIEREPFIPAATAHSSSGELSEPAIQYPSAADWFRKVGKTAAENVIRERREAITAGKVRREAAVLWNKMPEGNKAPGARQAITKEAFKHAEKRAPKERGRGGTV